MNLRIAAAVGAALFALAAPSAAPAHFILQQPASWLVESPLGDPRSTHVPVASRARRHGTH